jgi:RimJ/RimL family protein N-acetyltransferase
MPSSSIRLLTQEDKSALEAFLLPRIDSSMFLIGNLRATGLEYRDLPYYGTYAARFDDGKIAGVAAHYWNGNLILQAENGAAELCREAVKASRRPVAGMIGPGAQVESVKRALGLDPAGIQMDETENLYRLDLIALTVPDLLSSGAAKARPAEPGDLDLLAEWRVEFSMEGLGAQDGPALRRECRESIGRSIRERRTWILEAEGKPASTSSFNSAVREAVQVGGVWTPPPLRRRGYARAVVAASLLSARADGVQKGILFTGRSNLPAQKAYAALGFRHAGDYRVLLLRLPMNIMPGGTYPTTANS